MVLCLISVPYARFKNFLVNGNDEDDALRKVIRYINDNNIEINKENNKRKFYTLRNFRKNCTIYEVTEKPNNIYEFRIRGLFAGSLDLNKDKINDLIDLRSE